MEAPTNSELMVLRKAIPEAIEKAASNATLPGEYPVDFTIRVFGSVKKGDSYSQAVPLSIPWQTLFGVALSRLNKQTGKSIEELANDLMTEVDGAIKQDAEAVEAADEKIKPHVENILRRLVQSTTRIVSGKITSRLNLVILARSPYPGTPQPVTEIVSVPASVMTGEQKVSTKSKASKPATVKS